MITRELLKTEVDKVQDKYLGVLYKIIKALENSSELITNPSHRTVERLDWGEFIVKTYGCLANDPIQRGAQGQYEVREAIE